MLLSTVSRSRAPVTRAMSAAKEETGSIDQVCCCWCGMNANQSSLFNGWHLKSCFSFSSYFDHHLFAFAGHRSVEKRPTVAIVRDVNLTDFRLPINYCVNIIAASASLP